MTQIIGRLTGDAEVKSLESGTEVVNFTIAINDDYKPKSATAYKEQVTFIQCGYWLGTGIAAVLRKGAIVEAGGRLFPTAYMKDNMPAARINLQVQHVKVVAYAKKDAQAEGVDASVREEPGVTEPASSASKTTNKAKSKNTMKARQSVQTTAEADQAGDLPF